MAKKRPFNRGASAQAVKNLQDVFSRYANNGELPLGRHIHNIFNEALQEAAARSGPLYRGTAQQVANRMLPHGTIPTFRGDKTQAMKPWSGYADQGYVTIGPETELDVLNKYVHEQTHAPQYSGPVSDPELEKLREKLRRLEELFISGTPREAAVEIGPVMAGGIASYAARRLGGGKRVDDTVPLSSSYRPKMEWLARQAYRHGAMSGKKDITQLISESPQFARMIAEQSRHDPISGSLRFDASPSSELTEQGRQVLKNAGMVPAAPSQDITYDELRERPPWESVVPRHEYMPPQSLPVRPNDDIQGNAVAQAFPKTAPTQVPRGMSQPPPATGIPLSPEKQREYEQFILGESLVDNPYENWPTKNWRRDIEAWLEGGKPIPGQAFPETVPTPAPARSFAERWGGGFTPDQLQRIDATIGGQQPTTGYEDYTVPTQPIPRADAPVQPQTGGAYPLVVTPIPPPPRATGNNGMLPTRPSVVHEDYTSPAGQALLAESRRRYGGMAPGLGRPDVGPGQQAGPPPMFTVDNPATPEEIARAFGPGAYGMPGQPAGPSQPFRNRPGAPASAYAGQRPVPTMDAIQEIQQGIEAGTGAAANMTPEQRERARAGMERIAGLRNDLDRVQSAREQIDALRGGPVEPAERIAAVEPKMPTRAYGSVAPADIVGNVHSGFNRNRFGFATYGPQMYVSGTKPPTQAEPESFDSMASRVMDASGRIAPESVVTTRDGRIVVDSRTTSPLQGKKLPTTTELSAARVAAMKDAKANRAAMGKPMSSPKDRLAARTRALRLKNYMDETGASLEEADAFMLGDTETAQRLADQRMMQQNPEMGAAVVQNRANMANIEAQRQIAAINALALANQNGIALPRDVQQALTGIIGGNKSTVLPGTQLSSDASGKTSTDDIKKVFNKDFTEGLTPGQTLASLERQGVPLSKVAEYYNENAAGRLSDTDKEWFAELQQELKSKGVKGLKEPGEGEIPIWRTLLQGASPVTIGMEGGILSPSGFRDMKRFLLGS